MQVEGPGEGEGLAPGVGEGLAPGEGSAMPGTWGEGGSCAHPASLSPRCHCWSMLWVPTLRHLWGTWDGTGMWGRACPIRVWAVWWQPQKYRRLFYCSCEHVLCIFCSIQGVFSVSPRAELRTELVGGSRGLEQDVSWRWDCVPVLSSAGWVLPWLRRDVREAGHKALSPALPVPPGPHSKPPLAGVALLSPCSLPTWHCGWGDTAEGRGDEATEQIHSAVPHSWEVTWLLVTKNVVQMNIFPNMVLIRERPLVSVRGRPEERGRERPRAPQRCWASPPAGPAALME